MTKKGRDRMAVSMRERPVLTGKDAERFLSRTKRNEELLKKYVEKKMGQYEEMSKRNRD